MPGLTLTKAQQDFMNNDANVRALTDWVIKAEWKVAKDARRNAVACGNLFEYLKSLAKPGADQGLLARLINGYHKKATSA